MYESSCMCSTLRNYYLPVYVLLLLLDLYIFQYSFYVCFLVLYVWFLFCVFCVSVLFCVLCLLLYMAVSFLFLYKFIDHCHRLET